MHEAGQAFQQHLRLFVSIFIELHDFFHKKLMLSPDIRRYPKGIDLKDKYHKSGLLRLKPKDFKEGD